MRKWQGNPSSVFCDQSEYVDHLFFECPVASCIWGMVGSCFQASNVPDNYNQYKQWIEVWLPDGKVVHHFGFAALGNMEM